MVPWKEGKGYAKRALKEILLDARREGLAYVEITTTPSNIASQRVIQANGAEFIEKFTKTAHSAAPKNYDFESRSNNESPYARR